MPEVHLHYSRLDPGKRVYVRDVRGELFAVSLGQRLRLDPERHPEAEDHLRSGIAVIEKDAPPRKGLRSEAIWIDVPLALLPPVDGAKSNPLVARLRIKELKKALRRCVVRDNTA